MPSSSQFNVCRQLDGFVTSIGLDFEPLGLYVLLSHKQKTVALPVEDLDLVTTAVEEREQHRVEDPL